MRRFAIVAILAILSLGGCTATQPQPAREVAETVGSNAGATIGQTPPQRASPVQPTTTAKAQPPLPIRRPAAPAAQHVVAGAKSAKPVPPANAAVPVATPTRPRAQPKVAATPEKAQKAARATLDLAALEQRLRDTPAIGVFTKLSLKNQVDDLLDRFRSFYGGQIKTQLADLRQRYDLLLMKVLTLLQDSDSQLAAAILASREAIWGVLRDPNKFAQIPA